MATDAQGNVYVAGHSNSVDFPVTNGQGIGPTPPIITLANAGQTITPLPIGAEVSATAIGGTPDGKFLYAATADGIFFSANGGATWEKTAPLPIITNPNAQSLIVNDIAVDTIDPARAYVATSRGMFATSSHGLDWRPADYGLAGGFDSTVFAQSVTVNQVDHTILYATTGRPNFLYKSTSAAGTWQLLNPSYPGEPPAGSNPNSSIVAALAPGGSDLYVVNANGTLLKSTDGGATWQKLSGINFFNTRVLRIDPSNPSNIFVLDNSGVHVSHDGGVTFSTVLPPSVNGIDVTAFAWDSSSATLYLATFNAVYASTDQGATLKVVPQLVNSNIRALQTIGGRVFAALDTPQTPFLVKFDPTGSQILYSTFFAGGLINFINGLSVDSHGNAYLAGYTTLPVSSFTTNLGSPVGSSSFTGFIVKVSADGTSLLYADAISASQGVFIQGLAVDAAGAAYITGQTRSPDFPTTPNAFQTKFPTTTCTRPPDQFYIISPNTGNHAFVSKLTPDGSAFAYSTFLTGSCGSLGQGLTVNTAGEVVVGGSTTSPDFPVSTNAYQPIFPGPVDKTAFANAFNVGFVAKLSVAGDKLLAGTYVGGGYTTQANAIALDSSGNPYITGATWGIAPGATAGAYQTSITFRCNAISGIGGGGRRPPSDGTDVFILQLDPALSTARFLTYLGGGCFDSGSAIALDRAGNAWVAGITASNDFPMSAPFQGIGFGGGFVSELSGDGSRLLFSSLSDGSALAIGPNGTVHVAGASLFSSTPKVAVATNFATSAFLANIDPLTSPAVTIDGIEHLNAFPSLSSPPSALNGVAPGEYIRIRGHNLGPANTVNAQLDSLGRLPFVLGTTRVFFDNFAAPLISVQETLIYCFVPFEISRVAQLSVESSGQRSNAVRIGVVTFSPQILAIANQDGSRNTADHPAQQGSVVTLYLTGLGQTNPGGIDGLINSKPLPVPVFPVTVFLGSQVVQPQFVGAAAGLIAGISQVNVLIPVGNYSSNALNISLSSANGVVYIVR